MTSRARRLFVRSCLFACLSLLISPVFVVAQQDASPPVDPVETDEELTEVVTVTANKRKQEIQDVGISVSVLDGQSVQELGLTTTTDLVQQFPNVYLQDTLGGPGLSVNVAIRGVGLNDFNNGTEPASVLYVDDFYVAPLSAGSMLLYDVERVEVLRGPQGTLFGRNITGGLIHYVTREPSTEFGGFASLNAGEYGLLRFEGAADLRLSAGTAARISVMSDNNDPWVRNIASGPDGHERDFDSVRGQIRSELSDSVTSSTKLTVSRARGLFSMRQGDLAESFDANGFLVNGGPGPFLSPQAAQDITRGETNRPDDLDARSLLAIQRFDWRVRDLTFTSVSGFLDLDQTHVQDCDGTMLDSCLVEFPYDAKQLTQELRFNVKRGRTHWTAGLYYLTQKSNSHETAALDLDGAFGGGTPGFGLGGPFILDADWSEKKDALAAFGQAEVDINRKVTLIAGLRFSDETKRFESIKKDYVGVAGSSPDRNLDFDNMNPGVYIEGIGGNVNFVSSGPALPVDTDFDFMPDTLLPIAGPLTKKKDSFVDGKLGINWKLSDEAMVYGSWTRGTKAGGFNNGLVSALSNAEIPFGPETIDAFEVGFKSRVLSRTTRLTGAVFHYDYDDYQAAAFERLGTRTLNRDARLTGGELELSSNFKCGVGLRFGVGVLDTSVRNISNGTTTFDAEMGLAPDLSVNGLVRYARPVGPGVFAIQGDFNYVDDQFQDVLNDPGVQIPAHTISNARVSYIFGGGSWEFSAWVKNLTGEDVPNLRYNLGFGSIISLYRAPRWYGTGVTVNF